MGWLSILVALIAAYLHWGHSGFSMWTSLLFGVLAFWSWGVMHNFAMQAARKRDDFAGGFYDIQDSELESVPNWIALVNFFAAIGCLGMLIVGLWRLF
ncbi:MAG: hypothetical protein IPN84_13060 [Sphingomonadales bacterium]|jgi:hypothetical protein|nr:hypothetical protein [Sphingomonadales bacterium]